MSTISLTDPTFMNEDAACAHFEKPRWPDGPVCPYCGVIEEAGSLGQHKGADATVNVRSLGFWAKGA